MSYECESRSAAELRALLGPASAPPTLMNTGDATSYGIRSPQSFDLFPNAFGLPYDDVSGFTMSPTVLLPQMGSFDSTLFDNLGSVSGSMGLQDWNGPYYGAWGDAASTPKLVQRQMKRRIQNRASQRAFRERKEKHARSLQNKIDQLELKLGDLKIVNEDLKRQLDVLYKRRDADAENERQFVSPASDSVSTSTTRDTSPTNHRMESPPDTGVERERGRSGGCQSLADDVEFECEHCGTKT